LPADAKAAVVWARRAVAIESCPKSYITAASETLVEEFLVRRRLGGMIFAELTARQVEAFLILEQAFAAETNHGEHYSEHYSEHNTRRAL
jgi:hypothetical protein